MAPSGAPRPRHAIAAIALLAWAALPGASRAQPLAIGLQPVLSGLSRPVAIAHAGDSRLFVVLQEGRVLVHDTVTGGTAPFLDMRSLVRCCGEEGLLGLTFHPDYAATGHFFVYYTNRDGDNVLARYRVSPGDPDVADSGSRRVLLTIRHPTFGNHNGGALAFGPDGYLYVGVGDGGSGGDPSNHGQSRATWLGKILRLDVDVGAAPYYAIPPTNPLVGEAGARAEIWAYGLRNPWRISFDRETGDLFIADVGQNQREEVNRQPAASAGGENYGWRRMEGSSCFNPGSDCQTTPPTLVLPILEYGHDEGCSVTGGYRYRGAALPALRGIYVFGDFCAGDIWGGVEAPDGTWTRIELLADTGLRLSTFGEDAAGELYVADLDGAVYRFGPPRLHVSRNGPGAGSVVAAEGGIACPDLCSAEYEPGALVSLTAIPDGSSTFAGWGGACGGAEDCAVAMDGDRFVTASFPLRPVVQFSAAAYAVSERKAAAKVTVQRTANAAGTVTVEVAASPVTAFPDSDYLAPAPGVLTFGPGITSQSLSVPLVRDAWAELPETLQLTLGNPGGGAILGSRSQAVLTIQDNDPGGVVQFARGSYRVTEGPGAVRVTVKRSDGTGGGVSVAVAVVGGTAVGGLDHAAPATPVTLHFAPGQRSAAFDLPILDDPDVEPDETIVLALQDPQLAALGKRRQATIVLVDDDRLGTFRLARGSYTAKESNGSLNVTVSRSGGAGVPATVDVAFEDGSATGGACDAPGADYAPAPQTVQFAAGQTQRTVVVPICRDGLPEPAESFSVRLEAPTNGFALGSVPLSVVTIP
jgi:glucose/arabinose dehydrogenase